MTTTSKEMYDYLKDHPGSTVERMKGDLKLTRKQVWGRLRNLQGQNKIEEVGPGVLTQWSVKEK